MGGDPHCLAGDKKASPCRGKPILKADENGPERAAKREQRHTTKSGVERHQPDKAKPDHTNDQSRHPFNGRRRCVCLQGSGCHGDINPE